MLKKLQEGIGYSKVNELEKYSKDIKNKQEALDYIWSKYQAAKYHKDSLTVPDLVDMSLEIFELVNKFKISTAELLTLKSVSDTTNLK